MQLACGCAFTLSEVLYNFPYKKLKIDCAACELIINDRHRNKLVARIFRYSIFLIIDDIINRNVTFWLPLNGIVKCNMHMNRVTGKTFLQLRRAGKWLDVDFLKSNFAGYLIGLFMFGKRTPRIKNVYVDTERRRRITENTNNGMAYGNGKIDTTLKDYIKLVHEYFPSVPLSDIKRILTYSWKSLYLHNSYGGDVMTTYNSDWVYFGNLKGNAMDHFHYYIRKLIIRLKIMYRKKKILWDGYYYFALDNNQYESYLLQKKPKGRPRKYFSFKNIMAYLLIDECRLAESGKSYIFRFKSITFITFKYFILNFKKQIELFEVRKPLKFKDILVQYNNYELL